MPPVVPGRRSLVARQRAKEVPEVTRRVGTVKAVSTVPEGDAAAATACGGPRSGRQHETGIASGNNSKEGSGE